MANIRETDSSYEFRFKYGDIIDLNYESDLYIMSISIALSDLTKITQKLHSISINNTKDNGVFDFKIGLGFARETFELLKSVFSDNNFTEKYLSNCPKIFDDFKEVSDIVYQKSDFEVFNESKMNNNRHLIFHYPKEKVDFDLMKKAIVEIEKTEYEVCFRESEDISKYEYQFAENLQFNMLFDFYKINENQGEVLEKRISELAIFTGKLMNILRSILTEYLYKKSIKWETSD